MSNKNKKDNIKKKTNKINNKYKQEQEQREQR